MTISIEDYMVQIHLGVVFEEETILEWIEGNGITNEMFLIQYFRL